MDAFEELNKWFDSMSPSPVPKKKEYYGGLRKRIKKTGRYEHIDIDWYLDE